MEMVFPSYSVEPKNPFLVNDETSTTNTSSLSAASATRDGLYSGSSSSPSSASMGVSSSTNFSPWSPVRSSMGYQCFWPSPCISISQNPTSVWPVMTHFPSLMATFWTETDSSPKIASRVTLILTFNPFDGLSSIDIPRRQQLLER